MSNSAWCHLNSKGDILKLDDKCRNPKCNCQKIITFTPHQNVLEGGSIKSILRKNFKGTQTAWNIFLKSAVNVAASFLVELLVLKQGIQKLDRQRLIF